MKQTFTNLRKMWLLLLIAVATHTSWAQCPDDGVFYDFDLTPAGPGQTATFGCVYGGEFYLFNVVAGETYYINSCGTAWDSQLTLRDDLGNFIAYDDDSAPCGGGAAELTWTATYTGLVSVQINEFDCTSNTICGDLTVTWVQGAVIFGCTDPGALNYNVNATVDDGSCQYPTICDCQGTQHTIGVLTWLGDTFADDGSFNWEGQPVDFNCATWGYDCGDIAGAPANDPYAVCLGQLPPNNGCGANDVFGCTDPLANNYNVNATVDDGSCTYDILGCTDPLANNYNVGATIDDGSCLYSSCSSLMLNASQMPCTPDATDVLNPAVDFTFTFAGGCNVTSLVVVLGGIEYPFDVVAPGNVSGSVFGLTGFPSNSNYEAYYVLTDGTVSPTYNFFVGDCAQDATICDCAGTVHTIGVLSWIGDTFADDGAFAWAGQPVDFNCATWGYDCGDIVGAPLDDPNAVCSGNLPPNNGCIVDVFGCTDPLANNYNVNATVNDGSCTYDILGCTDPLANNYNPSATIEDGSCTYGACTNLTLDAVQTPCIWDGAAQAYNPGADFTFLFDGSCTVTTFVVNVAGTEYPFPVAAPFNVSGSQFGLAGFPNAASFSAYYVLSDGTVSDVYDYVLNDCANDALICDCDGNAHTIGVLSWIGDTFADDATYTWGGQTVNFNCATWGYDCGDVVGAPAEDPFGVCAGNLPPNSGCIVEIFGCTDPLANNYNVNATVNDGSCTYDILGCTDPLANNYNVAATIDDGSCLYGSCSSLMLNASQMPCTPDATDVLNPSVDFTFTYAGDCNVTSLVVVLGGIEYPFDVAAPGNVSGSVFGLIGFPSNASYEAYYVLTDGTVSPTYNFVVGDCGQDATICDCAGTVHTIGVLSWIGDTFADNGAYAWAGQPVDFNCATWGYDCGDIVGAPLEDPYAVCSGNMPPNNGCAPDDVLGCTDITANNYNANATVNDGSCTYDVFGCTDATANNYNSNATVNDGSCTYDVFGCTDATANNYNSNATVNDGSCTYDVFGCTDATANNYNANATVNDGSCTYDLFGCTDANASNYNSNATVNDGSCIYEVYGCTDANASNYNATATVDDGSCTYDVLGCTDPTASNYNMDATIDDGSCVYNLCSNLVITGEQALCQPDANGVLLPGMDFTLNFNGDCTAQTLVLVFDGVEYPFDIVAPDNVSGSVLSFVSFPENITFTAYFTLSDGSTSLETEFSITSCSQDPVICDCDGNAHTIGVLSWIGDTFADDGTFTWGGQTVNFNCATWGYDCGDITGAPAEDPNGVCFGNLPPNNGCSSDIVLGCTDATANNYNPAATLSDGSCTYDVLGCTDATASNYNPNANVDNGSCTYDVLGCTDATASNYNPNANVDDGSCTFDLLGCTDATANNYNAAATVDDGSCTYDVLGCTDATANNYNTDATVNDGSCTYDVSGCTDATANNYNAAATIDDGSCTYDVSGCTDATANNYNADATVDDGSCTYDVFGCTDPIANNYNADATVDDGSCIYDVFGCTDATANNYNMDATVDDGSCTYDVFGCTDPTASNYNMDATIDDGSCTYETCFNLVLTAEQTPCTQDNAGVLNPGVDFTFTLDGAGCTIDSLFIVLDGTVIPFEVTAPDNVSGSVFPLTGFPANSSFSAFYSLSDGTISNVFNFSVGDCSQDAVICDCDQNEHTIGVLSWIGDTFADNGAYTWAGVPVNFNCATWGYDCGDIAGAPAEDPYGVCQGNLPPSNGCGIIAVEEITSMNIEAYPNPTSGMITLVNRGEGGNKQIRVFDQTGKLQFAEQRTMAAGSSEMFNLSALAAGTYHAQVVGNNGVSNITVIVQK